MLYAKLAMTLAGALVLTGCGSGKSLEARLEEEKHLKCLELGAKPGTDIYIQCRLQLMQIEAAQNQAGAAQSANALAVQRSIQQNFTRPR